MIRYIRWSLFSALSGFLAGLAATVFLILLDWATQARDAHAALIWVLPVAGFCIGWCYHHFAGDAAAGHNLILDEIHDPKKIIPLRMAPLVLFGTVVTHLFGGSAGREGTAVQMGASLSDQLAKYFRIDPEERKILLVAGAGAGFGSAIGAPLAGVIFGMEVINIGRLRLFAWFECLMASFVGYYTTVLLRAPHTVYPQFQIPDVDFKTLFFIALAGIVFGVAAKGFTVLVHGVEKVNSRLIRYAPLKPFFAGVLLVGLYYIEGSYHYVGLGIQYIQAALQSPSSFSEPAYKAFFTALTVGSGFKGGEFIPLVFIGTTLGSALSVVIPVSFQLLAAVGFAAVFAGAANTPIACVLMACEIFGFQIAPYAIVACFMSYYFSGHHGIYSAQRVHIQKHKRLVQMLSRFGARK